MMIADDKFRSLTIEDPIVIAGNQSHLIEIHDGKNESFNLVIADEVALHFLEKYHAIKENGYDMTVLIIAGEIIGILNKIEKDSELVSTLYEFNRIKDLRTIKNHSLVKFRKNSDSDVEYFIPIFYIDNNQKGYCWNDNKNKNIKQLIGHKDEVDW